MHLTDCFSANIAFAEVFILLPSYFLLRTFDRFEAMPWARLAKRAALASPLAGTEGEGSGA